MAFAGLIAVPINFRLVGPEISYIVEDCDARAIIVQDDLLDKFESVRASLPIAAHSLLARHPGAKAGPYRVHSKSR